MKINAFTTEVATISYEVELTISKPQLCILASPIFCGRPQLTTTLYKHIGGRRSRVDSYLIPLEYVDKTEDAIIQYILHNFNVSIV